MTRIPSIFCTKALFTTIIFLHIGLQDIDVYILYSPHVPVLARQNSHRAIVSRAKGLKNDKRPGERAPRDRMPCRRPDEGQLKRVLTT